MRTLLFFFSFLILSQTASADPAQLEAKAAELIEEREGDQALDVLKELTDQYPDYASGHMNYGSILFTKARFIFQNENQAEAMPIFQEAQTHLLKATELYGDQNNPAKAHGYYLLGDINLYVFQNREKAREHYNSALAVYPDHQGAKAELKRLDEAEAPIPTETKPQELPSNGQIAPVSETSQN